MQQSVFSFKQFEVSHGKGSMKVGVDAVLLGAWTDHKAGKILDVGTGCGVIALMMAQRFPDASVDAIDIDPLSVEEAYFNFSKSEWKDKMKVWNAEFPKDLFGTDVKYDLIVSNPPYFLSGVDSPQTQRERARHQDSLSVFSLIEYASKFMNDDGGLAMIFPSEFENKVMLKASKFGLFPKKICRVKNSKEKSVKRVMIELVKNGEIMLKEEELTLFKDGMPTLEYKNLCKDFYLKF